MAAHEIDSLETLWQPTLAQIASTRLADYQSWLTSKRGLHFDDYATLWQWSVDDVEVFWQTIWDYFDIQADGAVLPVLGSHQMPGADWYPNVRINYAEHIFRNAVADQIAVIARAENEPVKEVSWQELQRDTGAMAAKLRSLGVVAGDRVASYLPNRVETVVAFLACASLGAI
jgi:acetoacetyl-CoA synthetase